jgi:hypothetical protein
VAKRLRQQAVLADPDRGAALIGSSPYQPSAAARREPLGAASAAASRSLTLT